MNRVNPRFTVGVDRRRESSVELPGAIDAPVPRSRERSRCNPGVITRVCTVTGSHRLSRRELWTRWSPTTDGGGTTMTTTTSTPFSVALTYCDALVAEGHWADKIDARTRTPSTTAS